MMYSFFVSILIFVSAATVHANDIFIVSNKARNEELKKDDIQDLFSGRKRMIGDWRVDLVDQTQPDLKASFYRLLLNRSVTQINVNWAELVFSGRAKAPAVVPDNSEVINFIVKNPQAIGYVSEKTDVSQVHVVMKLSE